MLGKGTSGISGSFDSFVNTIDIIRITFTAWVNQVCQKHLNAKTFTFDRGNSPEKRLSQNILGRPGDRCILCKDYVRRHARVYEVWDERFLDFLTQDYLDKHMECTVLLEIGQNLVHFVFFN